jgi:asparagine synthase (glutamine-hydrolysing)
MGIDPSWWMMGQGLIGIVRRKLSAEPLRARISQLGRLVPIDLERIPDRADAALFAVEIAHEKRSAVPAGAVVASGTVRNRIELAAGLGLNAATARDEDLLVEAFRRWGRDCCRHIYGDWCLAAWDQERRELLLARDQHGNAALYYHVTDDAVAFATSLPLLLALKLGPVVLDRLYLAQVLVAWTAYHGERTALSPVMRVPRAHSIVIAPQTIQARRYWCLDDVAPLKIASREDYAAGFRAVFDTAVRQSLPSAGTPAVTLSGGLDSGSVAVTAAHFLAKEGRRLAAYVATPVANYQPYVSERRIGDEYPLAQLSAAAAANIDLTSVRGRQTPIAAIRRVLEILPMPQHAAGNYYWLHDIFETAAAHGSEVLLTGQFGNSGISWPGDVVSQPLRYQIRKLGLRGWAERHARKAAPPMVVRAVRILKKHRRWRRSAILPEFAAEQNLFERWLADPMEAPYLPALQMRFHILKPGRSAAGDLQAGFAAACGMAVCDPTADPRVLEYCFAVPDHIFIDPATGTDRWLIRAAMQGRLPDAVRLNHKRGQQAADLVPRLRACRDEVEDALQECEAGAAAGYVDVSHMRRVWHRIETEDNRDVLLLAMTVLTRGNMAGLFVNGIGKGW